MDEETRALLMQLSRVLDMTQDALWEHIQRTDERLVSLEQITQNLLNDARADRRAIRLIEDRVSQLERSKNE